MLLWLLTGGFVITMRIAEFVFILTCIMPFQKNSIELVKRFQWIDKLILR